MSSVSPYDWSNDGSAVAFSHMMSMVLLLWGICTILGNGYGIHGQNYVALLQGIEMIARFHYKNLTLGI